MKRSLIAILLVTAMLMGMIVIPSGAASDPAENYTHIDAEYEDAGLSLWFDYSSEKKAQNDVSQTEMETFVVYMAKNEIEDAQFFLSADSARSGLTADVTDFVDANGNTVEAELFIEYYHDAANHGMIPDAIPPLEAYGAFDIEAGKSQGFLIKLKTTAETVAGDYSATLSVYDADNKQIKTATVYAHVWDFALSEETATSVSMHLSYGLLTAEVESSLSNDELYKNYYDYLLENRICATQLPYALTSSNAAEYLDNPRVRSYQFSNKGGYVGSQLSATEWRSAYGRNYRTDDGTRLDKGYYFANVVDAAVPADLEALRAKYDEFTEMVSATYKTDLNFISTYINDIDYTLPDGTVIDQIDYYDDFVNLWCSKTFAYTSEEELNTVNGAKVLQPLKWNDVYGTFVDRMAAQKAEGDKIWWFISWDVEAPYINYYMQTDGVAQRIMFWQQFDFNVEGFLYNFANYWSGDCADPYANNVTNSAYPDAHGESILIYPGDVYGIDTPVGSLRIEAMRDGVEDYQMLYMLEELRGEGAGDKYIDLMTTGVVSYSTDDSEYYNARIKLGNAVEAAVHGVDEEPDVTVEKGDIDGNGSINSVDLFKMNLFVKQISTPTAEEAAAADIDDNTKVTSVDMFYLKFRILKGYWGFEDDDDGEDNVVTETWVSDENGLYYIGADGNKVYDQWIHDGIGWRYVGNDGYIVTCAWILSDNGWRYMDDSGYAITHKWVQDSNGWCYLGDDGCMVTDQWVQDDIGWRYVDATGYLVTNQWVGDYYVGEDGYRV